MIKPETLTFFLLAVPLIGSGLILIAGKSRLACQLISISSTLLTLIITFSIARTYAGEPINPIYWKWIELDKISLNFIFEFSRITIPLLLIVASISSLVHFYSFGFFKWDEQQPRYFATLSFFTFTMLGLTLSGNMIQLFIFWELISLSSYLLISFYRTKPEAAEAGTKALIMNKIGDAGFIIAIMAIYSVGRNLEITSLPTLSIPENYKIIIGVGLLIAAFSKSAQFPFHSWLPDAMQGPAPVSALIHSATMVAAGVFLLIRLQFLFTPIFLEIISVIGAITAVLGGINALREKDIKRLLAWSTISQLGLMIMTLGNLGFESAYIHLLSHAIFKAGLFLAAGVLMLNSADATRDALSETKKTIAFVLATSALCLSLMGMPLTIGFLSKEYLLSAIDSPFYLSLFFLVNALTIFYSVRVLSILFPITGITATNKTGNINNFMMLPVILLSIGSLWFFYSLSPFSALWVDEMFNLSHPSLTLSLFSALWGIGFLIIAWQLNKSRSIQKLIHYIPDLSRDNYLHVIAVKPVLFLAHSVSQADSKIIDQVIHGVAYLNLSTALLVKWVDENWVDGFARLCVWLMRSIGNVFRQFVTGKIQSYIWWTFVALVIIFMLSRS